MERGGEAGPNPITTSSKYGSVSASAHDIAISGGMNEAGLVANLLWLVDSGPPAFDGSQTGLSTAAWTQ